MLLDGGEGQEFCDNNILCRGIRVERLRQIPNRPGALQYSWELNTNTLRRFNVNASDIFVTLYYERDDGSR